MRLARSACLSVLVLAALAPAVSARAIYTVAALPGWCSAPGNNAVAAGPDGAIVVSDCKTFHINRTGVTAVSDRAAADLAVLPDGSVLLAGNGSVERVDRTGKTTTVVPAESLHGSCENTPGEYPVYPGAGDPHVAALADGGFLLASRRVARVFKVSNEGEMTAVAGTGSCVHGPGSGSAAAQPVVPDAITGMPDGGFVVADGPRVVRVSPDGAETTIAGNGAYGGPFPRNGQIATRVPLWAGDVAVSRAGRPLLVAGDGVFEVATDGRLIRLAGGGDRRVFAGDGMDAASVGLESGNSIAVDETGGILIGEPRVPTGFAGSPLTPTHGVRVRYVVPPGQSGRSAVGITATTPTGRELSVRVAVRGAQRVTMSLSGGDHVIARRTKVVNNGEALFRIRQRLRAGRQYVVSVLGSASDGSVTSDQTSVIRGQLPVNVARSYANLEFGGISPDAQARFAERCRRASSLRVDCEIYDEGMLGCSTIVAASLARDGQVYMREYGCPLRPGRKLSGSLIPLSDY